jgi:hypothetical protein
MQEKLAPTQLEDTEVILAAPGEMVVPPVVSESTQAAINADLQSVGLNPNDFVVGNGRINQITGLQQFGFLSDVFKKVKKVVKKVAPIAVSFIPGVGPVAKAALTAVAGKASGMDTKDALLAGLTAGAGAKFAGSGVGAASKTAGKGIFGGTLGPRIKSGLGNFFNPAEGTPGIFKGNIGPNLRRGIGNLFSPNQMTGRVTTSIDDFGTPQYELDGRIVTRSELQQMGYSFDENNNPIAPQREGLFGLGIGPSLRDAFLGTEDQPNFLQNFLGTGEDQGFLGSGAGLASLAALYGLAAKKAAEKTEGGLTDIRASRRPDLVAQPVFQGFDVGIRPGMAKGGLSPELFELDFRKVGGPTIGIGTGTSDDIPAMLSDGEYVMTADANNGAGGFKISKTTDSITLIPDGKPDREKGAKNLGMLMDMFEDANKRMA